MADAVENAIKNALVNRLVALTTSPAIPLSLPNTGVPPSRVFTPPTAVPGAMYLRASFLPADSFALGIGYESTNQHYGDFRIDVFAYQGDGELLPGRTAAIVIAHFKRGTRLTRDGFIVDIGFGSQIPRILRMVKDDPWVFIPVSIPYLTFAGNPS